MPQKGVKTVRRIARGMTFCLESWEAGIELKGRRSSPYGSASVLEGLLRGRQDGELFVTACTSAPTKGRLNTDPLRPKRLRSPGGDSKAPPGRDAYGVALIRCRYLRTGG